MLSKLNPIKFERCGFKDRVSILFSNRDKQEKNLEKRQFQKCYFNLKQFFFV